MPASALEKWATFKAYNLRDVETEMAIQERLRKYPVPEEVWAQYHLDQQINDRGIGVDSDVQIRERKNLIGISYDVDETDVVTRIMPTGEDADGNILYLPELYIDLSLIHI